MLRGSGFVGASLGAIFAMSTVGYFRHWCDADLVGWAPGRVLALGVGVPVGWGSFVFWTSGLFLLKARNEVGAWGLVGVMGSAALTHPTLDWLTFGLVVLNQLRVVGRCPLLDSSGASQRGSQ